MKSRKCIFTILLITVFLSLYGCGQRETGSDLPNTASPSLTITASPSPTPGGGTVTPTDIPAFTATPTAVTTEAPTATPTAVTTRPPTQTPFPPFDDPAANNYSAEEIISYFYEVVLNAEYYTGSDNLLLRKWEKPIRYSLEGQMTPEDVKTFRRLEQTLNEIPGFPGFSAAGNPSESNLTIRFLPRDEYNQMAEDRIGDTNTDGYATAWFMNDIYYVGEIGISTDTEQDARNTVILEETIQSLGLFNDSYAYEDSIFYQGYTIPQWPLDIDWILVKLLYRPEFIPGMTPEEVRPILEDLLSTCTGERENIPPEP